MDDVQLWRQCGAKKVFKSEHAVMLRAHQIGIYYYQCPQCQKWHLTRKSKRRQRVHRDIHNILDKLITAEIDNARQ